MPGQAYLRRIQYRNQYQIHIRIPACVMNSERFTISSLYSVRLRNLRMDKIALKAYSYNLASTNTIV